LIILIFAPEVRIIADELESNKKSRYEKLIYDDNELSFDYFLTRSSIEDINGIRN